MKDSARFLVPFGLAIVAAVANYALIKRQVPKVEVLVVTADIAEGESITRDKIGKIVVGADERLFPSALKVEHLGDVETRAARRKIRAGEILFRADVEETILRPGTGEHTWTVNARTDRVALHLVPGDTVQVVVAPPAGGGSQAPRGFGPYRLLGWRGAEITGKERTRAYILAVPTGDAQEPLARTWIATSRNNPDAVQSIELITEPAASRAVASR